MEQAVTPRHSNPIRSLIKAILHIIVKIVIVTSRAIKRYPLPALIVIVMLMGGVFALSSGAVVVPGASALSVGSNPATTSSGALPAERATVEKFLTAQQNLNATGMLEAFSDEIQADPQARMLPQQIVEQMRASGLRYTGFKYVASTQLDDGRTVALYIVTASDGQQTQQMPYTFTLDRAYKIMRIE